MALVTLKFTPQARSFDATFFQFAAARGQLILTPDANNHCVVDAALVDVPQLKASGFLEVPPAAPTASGTTANRPVTNLSVGDQFYDTTLGYLVSVHSVGPPAVWHNGAGAAV